MWGFAGWFWETNTSSCTPQKYNGSFWGPLLDKFQTFSACFGRRFWERVAQQQKQLVTRVFIGLQGLNNLFRFSEPFGPRLLFVANSMRKVPGDFVWDTDGLPFQWLPPQLKNPRVEDTQTLGTAQIDKSPSKPALFFKNDLFELLKVENVIVSWRAPALQLTFLHLKMNGWKMGLC